MTLGSLFDGVGGFPLAASRVGITPIWASEIVPDCISITKRHFPVMRHLGDIREINGGDIEPVDIISFGSPCQDLSISGKRAGLDGEKSGLFLQAVRVIKEMRSATNGNYPTTIIWENVPGAFSSNKRKDFQKVLQEITAIAEPGISIPRPSRKSKWLAAGAVVGDCFSLAWRCLDAQYWSVPQRRRRIFLVASFGNQRAGEILFKPESEKGNIEKGEKAAKGIAGNVENGVRAAGFNGWRSVTGTLEYKEDCAPCINATMPPDVVTEYTLDIGYSTDHIHCNPKTSMTLRANSGGKGANTGLYCLPVYCIVGNTIDRTHKSGGNGTGVIEETSYTLNTVDRHAVAVPFICSGYGDYEHGNISKTILSSDDITSGDLIVSGYSVRRLTPLECERLQGLPDGWTEYGHDGKKISDSQRYKAIGNSVAIPCVEFILRQIAISNEQRKKREY
jgi:DNA (cytosine-5)-methyltransferase 1